MELQASNKKLEKILNDFQRLQRKIGLDMTRTLKRRIDQIKAADNFKEYLDIGLGDPHPLTGNLDNLFGIKLNKNYRLIVEPLSENLDDESLRKCKKIDLKGVLDYHDGKCEWIIP